ncbi:MAG: mechanosensitive ion channel family protein [Rhodospirillaceae bacterium]|nr:mechanosensitive ion channel family protein [Rhodospirillaceae bacterium]
MKAELETVSKLIDTLVEFAVQYGFQLLGALVFLFVGLKVATWSARRVVDFAEARSIDQTLARFIGNVVKVVLVAFVAIITLGNFGISIAPLIALAGAAAFGATMAIQGPLSNYGAGLSIILSRPFAVGDTICVKNVSGTVDDIKLAATVLIGEDKERITIPNKEIVGEVIVNSNDNRIVESRIALGFSEDSEKAIDTLRTVLKGFDGVASEPAPLVGVHDFTYGGVVLGLRFWVPGLQYFQTRYSVNEALLKGLRDAGISLQPLSQTSISMPPLSADAEV